MNPTASLVEKESIWFNEFLKSHPILFPEQNPLYPVLYPVPFFGDIQNAKVLTLALNPAWTEFHKRRNWLPGLDTDALTKRLVHYFHLPASGPHRWFDDRRNALDLLDCSYETNTAHIDLHPFPTKFRPGLDKPQRETLGHLIEYHGTSHLAGLLRLATKARLVLVVDYAFSNANGITVKTFDFITKFSPKNYNHLLFFSAGGPDQFEDRIRQEHKMLRDHLDDRGQLLFEPS